jgi:riboflavin synthase
MFTGIIEQIAEVVKVESEGSNVHITLKSTITTELKIDQSVAHNGVCLTVVAINGDEYTVTAIKETLEKSNIGLLAVGSKVNMERCLKVGGRLDGHMVQGHVDQTAAQANSGSDSRKRISLCEWGEPYSYQFQGHFFFGSHYSFYA